ncbi:MAG: DUF1549 and DUF1553 domain-containing protein [Roseibacillus sp.]|nr:DUF1549 and DUF1553 domain-containing protein [Roseibacillus sp.]
MLNLRPTLGLVALLTMDAPSGLGAGEERLAEAHWSFTKVVRPALPKGAGEGWALNSLDHFIAARLEKAGLQPSPAATKRKLIRRSYFDFLGLPPSPEEVDAFLADRSPDGYEKLIDRLLASPHFGERWGRHWLDVVRFAQTNGYEHDAEKPEAWRYRDWVIEAFNSDLPYDEFVRQQLAGDEFDPVSDRSITATTFYRAGPWDQEPDDKDLAQFDGLDDMLTTTCNAFLGVTLQCARCHDHPSDPFPQRDYYAMLSHFRNVKIDGTTLVDLPSGEVALAVNEEGPDAPETVIFLGGDPKTPASTVAPTLPPVLMKAFPHQHKITKREKSTGRRKALAAWITSPDNPLTARVIVNRLWHYHFGQGLVRTPNNFGKAGLPPSHPALLDWLASELIAHDWSLKHIHRLIATSATYRQSSRTATIQKSDPDNRLLWRQNSRRLEAEAIRDSVLAAAGALNLEAGGRGFFPALAPQVLAGDSRSGNGWEFSSEKDRRRRSIYIFAKRNAMPVLLDSFDCANPDLSSPTRQVTTVAPQALTLLNGPFINKTARLFTASLTKQAKGDREQQIRLAFRAALSRKATAEEVMIAMAYLARQEKAFAEAPEMIRLRPAVPPTMIRGFRDMHRPQDFFIGPRKKWIYYRGDSFVGMADLFTVKPPQGPFALWKGVELQGAGSITARLQFDRQAELASVIFRAQPKGELLRGYELHFDPRRHRVSLVKHTEDLQVLAAAELPPSSGWHHIHLAWTESRIRAGLVGRKTLLIDVIDPAPLPLRGRIGIRSWGGELRVNQMQIKADGKTFAVTGDLDQRTPADKALASFCNLLFNLNEFVYVD